MKNMLHSIFFYTRVCDEAQTCVYNSEFTNNKKGMVLEMSKKLKNDMRKTFVDCYYMTENEISVRDICEVIKKIKGITYECWEAAGVIEIELEEKCSVDIETLDMFKSEEDKMFLNKNNIKTIFSIKTDSDHKDKMIEIFRKVVFDLGGFVCSDSDDFKPFWVE